MKIKTYEVKYIFGFINPSERTINIETTRDLTEQFIKDEIERQRPNHKNQVIAILSTLLINEKELNQIQQNNNQTPIQEDGGFNW